MAGLQIQLFGGFSVWADGTLVKPFATKKTRALLAYLVLQPNQPQPRSALAALLWPDVAPERAAQNLRQTLTFLRQGLATYKAKAALIVDRQTVRFIATPLCTVDGQLLAESLRLATIDSLARAVTLFQGDLLTGFYLKDAPEFETWLMAERERWQTAVLQALDQLSAHHQARGEYETARGYLYQALAIDPWHEQAHRGLMRLLALLGDSIGALAQYKKCCEALLSGLGVDPLPETQALAAQIRTGSLPTLMTSQESVLFYFVGRGSEHANLVRLFQQGRKTPHLVLVAGALGIGKSRLLQEFARYAVTHDALLLSGRCLAFGLPLPYQPFVGALRSGLKSVRTPLTTSWQTELARLLPEIGLPPPEVDETGRQRLFTAVVAFIESLGHSHQPVLLLLDDLHWVDAASLDLLRFLLYYAPSRLLVVGAYRPEDTPAGHALTKLRRELSRDGLVTHLPLPPLEKTAVHTMAATLAQPEYVAEMAMYLWEESRGNAFVLFELLHEIAETHELVAVPWKLPPQWQASLLRLTDRLRDVVLGRVERLSAASQTALKKAAITGSAFDLNLLTAIHDDPLLPEYIGQWQQRGLIRPLGDSYEFTHHKIQTVLLEALLPEQKATWHMAVGQAMLQLRPHAIFELAHHFFLSTEPALSLPYFSMAAQQAAQALAFTEVVALCSQALTLVPIAPEMKLALLEQRQRAYQFLGEIEAEGEDAVALLALAQAAGDQRQMANAVQRLSRYYYLQGRVAEARHAVSGVLQVARESGDIETAVRILNMLAMLLRESVAGQMVARQLQSEALALAREVGDLRMQGLLLSDTAVLLSEAGQWGAALSQAAAGVALLRQAKEQKYLPHGLYIQGGLLRAVGQHTLANAPLAEALTLCQTHQLGTYLVQIFLEQGQMALEQHRLTAAKQAFSDVRKLAEEANRPSIVARTLLGLAQVAYEEGQFAEADGLLDLALTLCPADKMNLRVSLQAALALVLLGQDQEVAALEISTSAVTAVMAKTQHFTNRPQIYWAHARTLQATKQATEARRWLMAAAAIVRTEAETLTEDWREKFLAANPLRRRIMQQASSHGEVK